MHATKLLAYIVHSAISMPHFAIFYFHLIIVAQDIKAENFSRY